MGRLLFTVAITAVFVAVVAIVITRSVTRTGHDAATVSNEPHPEMLRLQVDGRTTPAVAVPGGRFHYHFRVTNVGDIALRNVAVRSEQVRGPSAPPRFQLLSVSDTTCAADGTVSCLFPSLAPGTSRTVRVEAMAARPRVTGEQIMIQTFVGCYVPDSGGGVDFSVIGDGKETLGRLAVVGSGPDRVSAGRRQRPAAGGPASGRASHGASHGASQGASQGASSGASQGASSGASYEASSGASQGAEGRRAHSSPRRPPHAEVRPHRPEFAPFPPGLLQLRDRGGRADDGGASSGSARMVLDTDAETA